MRLYKVLFFSMLIVSAVSQYCSTNCKEVYPACEGKEHGIYFQSIVSGTNYTSGPLTLNQRGFVESQNGSLKVKECYDGSLDCTHVCDQITCGGDLDYCDQNECDQSNPCICRYKTYKEVLLNNGQLIPLRKCWLARLSEDSRSKKRELEVSGNINYLQEDKTIIAVFSSSFKDCVISSESDDWLISHKLNKSPEIIIMPPSIYLFSQTIEVQLKCSDNLIKTANLVITGQSFCRLDDCILCWSAWDNFSCLPSTQKYFFVAILIILTALLLCTFPAILIILKLSWKILSYPFSCSYNTWKRMRKLKFMRRVELGLNKISSEFSSEEPLTLSPRIVEEAYSSSRDSGDFERVRPNWREAALAAVVVAAQIKGGKTCSVGAMFPVELTSCTGLNCTTSFEINIQMMYPTQQTCFTLSDSNSGLPLSTFKLTYLDVIEKTNLLKLYHTSGWEIVTESMHGCSGSSICNDAMNCATNDLISNPCPEGTMSGEQCHLPGVSTCFSSCGCVSCHGCPLCGPSCVYSRYGIRPKGDVYTVWTPQSISLNSHLRLEIEDNTGKKSMDFESPRVLTKIGDFKILVNSLFSEDEKFYGGTIISKDGTDIAWSGFGAEPNSPVAGGIGDIQANSVSDLKNPSINSFKFSTSMVSSTQLSNTITYQTTMQGIDVIDRYISFPIRSSGGLREFKSGSLQQSKEGLLPISITISAEGSYKLTRRVNSICPSFTIISIEGCRSCLAGSKMKIKAKSVCDEGLAIIKIHISGSLALTSSLSLKNKEEDYLISFQTEFAQNLVKLSVCGTTPCVMKEQSYLASDVGLIEIRNGTFVVSPTSRNSGLELGSLLDSSLTSSLIWVAIAIAAILIGLLLLWGCSKCKSNKSLNSKMFKLKLNKFR